MTTPTPAQPRRVAHLDMDAFYASVTLLRYPQLQGLPMVIGGPRLSPEALLAQCHRAGADPSLGLDDLHRIPAEFFPRLRSYRGRGVITTATYEARQYGLQSAMSLSRAGRLCPHAILLPVDFDEYRRVSRCFKDVVLSMAPTMEDRGIDEVYIEFTDAPDGQLENGRILALRLQHAIAGATGLSCSIGVAPNKLLAKIISEFDKPGGITILQATELGSRIWPLPCNRINGIGPKTWERLQALGIQTIGELAACSIHELKAHFGNRQANWLHQSAHGIDERPLVTHSEPVSISRETTFEHDLHAVQDRAVLGRIFTELAERTAADLQRKGYAGRTIGIKLRYADFRIATRDQTLDIPTQDARRIRETAAQCLKRVDLSKRLRLLGIRIGSLQPVEALDMWTAVMPPTSETETEDCRERETEATQKAGDASPDCRLDLGDAGSQSLSRPEPGRPRSRTPERGSTSPHQLRLNF
ncbi:MAG: DNA polymerase IV [Lautropia sp.]|nr:DNA polymerase IV [Lautropia sp.]